METDFVQVAALMGARLEAWQALGDEIAAAQRACVALDLEGMQAHDRQTQRLCADVSRTGGEIARLVRGESAFRSLEEPDGLPTRAVDPAILQRIRRLREQSEAARLEAGKRNQVYAEFLRRAQLTLRIMVNVISHCAGIYPSADLLAPAEWLFERGL